MEKLKDFFAKVGALFVHLWHTVAAFFVKCALWVRDFCVRVVRGFVPFWVRVWRAVCGFCVRVVRGFVPFWVRFGKGFVPFWKNLYHKVRTMTKKDWLNVWDKCTTGILLFLFASPILILLYILLWFVNK